MGQETTPFIIAEAGIEACGNPYNARLLIREAKKAGCDAIKFQAISAECSNNPPVYKEYAFDDFAWKAIKEEAESVGIEWFASVFCKCQLKKMEDLGCERFKTCAADLLRGEQLRLAVVGPLNDGKSLEELLKL
jgi:sialic acid synthase SpsE